LCTVVEYHTKEADSQKVLRNEYLCYVTICFIDHSSYYFLKNCWSWYSVIEYSTKETAN
jgi:hypothetical protein